MEYDEISILLYSSPIINPKRQHRALMASVSNLLGTDFRAIRLKHRNFVLGSDRCRLAS